MAGMVTAEPTYHIVDDPAGWDITPTDLAAAPVIPAARVVALALVDAIGERHAAETAQATADSAVAELRAQLAEAEAAASIARAQAVAARGTEGRLRTQLVTAMGREELARLAVDGAQVVCARAPTRVDGERVEILGREHVRVTLTRPVAA